MRRSGAVGVFDSGVGGLTVLKALRSLLPAESFLYLGDTARVPYGSKSKETVTRYSLAAARFLAGKGIKLLVVACNTASALALEDLKGALDVPVIGVIGPGIRAAASATRSGKIGVIATEATIESRAYDQALRRALPRAKVLGVACPLFVPLAEEGWWSHPVTRAVAREYLKPFRRGGWDTLILGCTHYPLLKPVLREAAGPAVRLIDSAEEAAKEAREMMAESRIAAPGGRGSLRFFASDGPARFSRLARRFLGASAADVEICSLD